MYALEACSVVSVAFARLHAGYFQHSEVMTLMVGRLELAKTVSILKSKLACGMFSGWQRCCGVLP